MHPASAIQKKQGEGSLLYYEKLSNLIEHNNIDITKIRAKTIKFLDIKIYVINQATFHFLSLPEALF